MSAQDAGEKGKAVPAKKNPPPAEQVLVNGESFALSGKKAFIMFPEKEKRSTPQPWVFYAPTLARTPDAHERWMHEKFLDAGIAVAGIDVGEGYGSPEAFPAFDALYRELTEKRGFAVKPCLLGRSRGGLWVSSWAIRHPERVAGIAGIYPVFDVTTYPGLKRAAPAYGMTPEELESGLAKLNPIERVGELARAKVPVYFIHGNIDTVVPLEANSAAFVKGYVSMGKGDLAELNVIEGQGHNHWRGFFECQPLVDFVIERARAGAGAK